MIPERNRKAEEISLNIHKTKRDWTEEQIIQLIDAAKDNFDIDLSDYARASLSRRITHVIKLFGFESLDELLSKIRSDKEFKSMFLNEITVGATEMFRDPELWIYLKNSLLPILSQSKSNYKFWVCGSSTGEEIFTLAVILKQLDMLHDSRILATDIDPVSLEFAQRGFYFNHSLEKNRSNYKAYSENGSLDDYLVKSKVGYQMDINLVNGVEFKVHDLVKDKNQEKFDIIFCRNVMIYFNQRLQNRVIQNMNANLNPLSYLILGEKESMMWSEPNINFKNIQKTLKVFQNA